MPEGFADDSLCLQAMQLDMHQSAGMRQAEHWRSVLRIPRTRTFRNTVTRRPKNKRSTIIEVLRVQEDGGLAAKDCSRRR